MHKSARNSSRPRTDFFRHPGSRGGYHANWRWRWDLTVRPQIENLEARVRDIQDIVPSLHHMLRPVHKLSPEILSRIARCLLDEDAIDSGSIIPLTHVCRRWRESIVSAPENWTLISNERVRLAKLSLERCRAAPLKLWLDASQARSNPSFWDLMTPFAQTTETLRLGPLSSIEELAQILPNFPQSMPNLRSLSLSKHINWRQSGDPFGQLTPGLTRLSLVGFPLYPSFLALRNLRVLMLRNYHLDLHCDTLLGFLEENPSLESATLEIQFSHNSFRISQRQVVITNRLRNLSIGSANVEDNQTLISRIALQRGAHLEITHRGRNVELGDALSAISMNHLSNLQSPTSMEYHPYQRRIRLSGSSGSFSYSCPFGQVGPFVEFPLLPLTGIREFRLVRHVPAPVEHPMHAIEFPPSSLPVLEVLIIEHELKTSHLLSALFSDPSSFPLFKTLAFLDCDLTDGFIEDLARFACNRKNTTSAWLYRVVIVSSNRNFPSVTSIDALQRDVPVVDIRIGSQLPTDLM